MRAARELKVGSKGYCKNCGFAIETVNVPNGKMFGSGPFWYVAWVHTGDRNRTHCFWTAEPKSHRRPQPTLYEQIINRQGLVR
jgi:hypothetical protein